MIITEIFYHPVICSCSGNLTPISGEFVIGIEEGTWVLNQPEGRRYSRNFQ
jgi:hypothetical protein